MRVKAFSIETKLYFISVIAVAALVTIASLAWFRGQYLYQIQEDVNHITEVEILLLRLDKINGDVITAYNPGHLNQFEEIYAELNDLIEHFISEADIVGTSASFLDELADTVMHYRTLSLDIVSDMEAIGRDRTEGHLKGIQESLVAADVALEKITDVGAHNAIHQQLMMLQHAEKDLMQLHLGVDIEKFNADYNVLRGDAQTLIVDEDSKQAFLTAISAYRDHFMQFSDIAMAVGLTSDSGLRAELDAVSLDAHGNINEIRKLIAATAASREKQIDTTIIIASAGLSLAILLLIHLLGRSIILPLRHMIGVMGSLAKGEYEITVPDRGRRDEIGKMAASLEVFRENAIEHARDKQSLQEANDRLEENVAARTQSLAESESAMFNMIHESPIAIGLTDEKGTPVFWNDSFLKFGWRKDTPGTSNDFQLMFADPDLRRRLFERLQRGETVRNQEVEILTASEDPAWIEMSIQSLVFEGQKSFLTWVHDITERKMKEAIQAEARNSAEEASQAKSNFLATMSHEIRTPLNGIMTMAEMLETTQLTTEQQGMASIVRDSSATLVSIINDVLDFSKIESGNLELDLVNMSLVQVVESVADLLGAQVAEKGIHLLTHVDPGAHDFYVGDPVRLRQILTNLAGNAVKFTEQGEIIIEVTTENSFPDRATAVFRVIDTGIGIPADKQEKLFNPFVQADSSTARQFGGTGLGLSISRALVEAMDGEIGVESTPGIGSTFWFKVPLKVKKEQRGSRKNQLIGKQAFIVSDNAALAKIIGNYLAFSGAKIETATKSGDALTRVRSAHASGHPIDMVVVDSDLPNKGAESLIGAMQDDNDMTAPRTVVMGYRSRMLVERPPYLSHVFAELPMPVRRNQLWEVAAAAVGLESLDDRVLHNNRDSDDGSRRYAPPDGKTAREEGAMILVAEDNRVNQQVIRMLLDRLGYAADIVENGALALDAIRSDNYGLLLTDCHMPVMDGYDLARQVRADEARDGSERIPIIALTADALIGVDEKCRACGMDDYLKKPISKGELNASILQLLPVASTLRRHTGGGLGGNASPAAQAFPATGKDKVSPGNATDDAPGEGEGKAVFDVAYLNEVTGGDPDMVQMLIDSYIDTTPPLIDDLIAAFDARDTTVVHEAAHAIKGASYMAGALRLGTICEKIQDASKQGDLDSVQMYKDVLHQEFESFLNVWKAHAGG